MQLGPLFRLVQKKSRSPYLLLQQRYRFRGRTWARFKMICARRDHGRCNTALKNKIPDLPSLTTLLLVSQFQSHLLLSRVGNWFLMLSQKVEFQKNFDKLNWGSAIAEHAISKSFISKSNSKTCLPQGCQLSRIIRETPDFGPYLPDSRLESDSPATSHIL